MNAAAGVNFLDFGGQTINWSHELNPEKLVQGWFCRCGLQCSSKGKLKEHTNSFNQPRQFNCKLCTQKFPSLNVLHHHMEKYHQIMHRGGVGCGDCGAIFKTRLEQARHRSTLHDDDNGHYSKKSPTKNHKNTGSPCIQTQRVTESDNSTTCMFTCSCGKVFSSIEYLNRHQRYKLKNFTCPLCQKSFGQWYNLKNHLTNKHVGQYRHECFECGKCGQVFPDIEHAVAHSQAMHGQHL